MKGRLRRALSFGIVDSCATTFAIIQSLRYGAIAEPNEAQAIEDMKPFGIFNGQGDLSDAEFVSVLRKMARYINDELDAMERPEQPLVKLGPGGDFTRSIQP